MKLITFFVVLFLSIGSICAQNKTITGIVLDADGNPVSDMQLKIKKSKATSLTDLNGKFSLEIEENITNYEFVLPEEYSIHKIEKLSENEFNLVVRTLLDYSLEELMTLDVTTASKKGEKITEIPASVEVITREDIQKYAYTSVTEILQSITGLYLIDDYYWLGSKNFGVRGFFSTGSFNNMVVLVNGVTQLSDKYGDYPDVKINVPIESIERIEVIKGPMSIIYGTGAFFGAINIITQQMEDKATENSVSAAYGNYNSQKLNAHFSGKQDDFHFTFNATYTATEGIDVPFSDLTTDLSALEYVGINTNSTTAGQMDDSRAYFNLALDYKDFFFDLAFIQTKKDIFDGQPGYYDGSEMTTKASNIVFGHQKEFSDKFSSRLKFGLYSHGHVIDYSVFRPNYYEIDAQNTNSLDIEWNLFVNLSDKIELNAGLYQRTVISLHQISDFGYYGLSYGAGEAGIPKDESYSTRAAYAQLEYKPTSKLEFIAGLRLEHLDDYSMYYSRGIVSEDPDAGVDPADPANRTIINSTYTPANNGFTLIPRFAMLYSLSKNSVVKLLYGTATKQPSFSENYRQLPGGRPQLDAAKIETYEINYITSLSSSINLSASVFYNHLDKLVVATNIRNQTTGEWEIYSSNSGEMQTIGVELGTKMQFGEKVKAHLSGVYQESKDLRPGYEEIELGYSPNLLANAGIAYKLAQNITLSVSALHVAEMQTFWKTATTPDAGYRIGTASPAYTLFDSKLKVTNLFNQHIYVEVLAKNIFDTETRYPTTSSNIWMDKGSLGFGRRMMVTLGFDF